MSQASPERRAAIEPVRTGKFASQWFDAIVGNAGLFDLVAAMTLVLLLFHANETWYLRVAVTVTAITGLLFRRVARRAEYWWVMSTILALVYAFNWDLWIVNHKFAMTYWALAIACALSVPPRSDDTSPTDGDLNLAPALADGSRMLIGLFFAFATLWKVMSPEFPDGSFFHFTLLTDPRFLDVTEMIGGLSLEISERNTEAIASLKQAGPPPDAVHLEDNPAIRGMAKFVSVWTIGIEGLIAVAFLWPARRRPADVRSADWSLNYWRNWLLIVFVATTFPIATVHGFAWLLTIMGLAQCDARFREQRLAYLLVFLGLPLLDIPFANLARTLFAS